MDFVIPALAGALIGFAAGWLVISGRTASVRERARALQEDKDTLSASLEGLRQENTRFRERSAALEATNEGLEERLSEQPKELEKIQEKLKLQFNQDATSLFEAISKKFSTQSEKQIGDLLTPLRERITDFQKLVTESFTTQGKEQHTLKAEIERIVTMNEQMRLQAEGLTKALRGDVKAQGNWGEVILERILEESGLQKGIGYTVQGMEMGLVNADGGRQQPDVIVNLPDAKHIIIDSKVTLTHYERYSSETDEAAKEAHLKNFLRSVRTHVSGLESKRYQDNDKLITPDFVLMFMPVEGAYSVAVQQDADLHHYAWERKIVIVCPATLFATLRTIASLWRIDQQNKNSQEIARRGGLLYDKFAGFVADMTAIGDNMGRTQKAYDSALGKLSEGSGNLMSQAETLRELGAKTSKALPKAAKAEESAEVVEIASVG